MIACNVVLLKFTAWWEIDSYLWVFGDGNISSFAHPFYTYTTSGSYPVTLTVTGPGGMDILSRAGCITVTEPAAADFSMDHSTGMIPLKVTFINQSENIG